MILEKGLLFFTSFSTFTCNRNLSLKTKDPTLVIRFETIGPTSKSYTCKKVPSSGFGDLYKRGTRFGVILSPEDTYRKEWETYVE